MPVTPPFYLSVSPHTRYYSLDDASHTFTVKYHDDNGAPVGSKDCSWMVLSPAGVLVEEGKFVTEADGSTVITVPIPIDGGAGMNLLLGGKGGYTERYKLHVWDGTGGSYAWASPAGASSATAHDVADIYVYIPDFYAELP